MKKLTRAMSILWVAIISICVLVFGVTATVLYAHAEGATLTEKELYNATNTYNVNDSIFDENGNIIPVDEERKNSDKQYRISYDMSSKNGNQVMSTPQVTVLTHGLGGSARHWSNDFSENNYKKSEVKFAYDEESLISRIDKEAGGANIYWACIDDAYALSLYNITDQKVQNAAYIKNEYNKIEHIEDISKHIIVVFQANTPLGSNDNIYYQFNYMMSKIAYDMKVLNGGILPKFNLVGHSRGGTTNLQYALDHPDMVDSLVSLGTPYFGSTTANLFGEWYIKDPSDGLDDILNTELNTGYYERWNDNYDTLYKNINANAFGSYHTLRSLIDAIPNTQGEEDLSNAGKYVISAVIAYLNARMLVPGNKIDLLRSFSKHIGTRLDWLFPNDKFADVLEIIGDEIQDDILPSFVAWRSDLLVPVKSQLAMDEGSITHLPMIYKGFYRKIRVFIGGDANYLKVSDPAPPVGHNLEARDSVIINNVLSVLNFGSAGFMTQEIEDGTVKIVGYKGAYESNELVIPESIGEKPVTEIELFAFSSLDKSGIEKITLPKTIKTIGAYVFSDFTDVNEIRFAADSELESIGMGAFNNCASLQSISLPDSTKIIAGNAFINCGNLTSVVVSENNASYTSVNGVLYNKNKNALICYPQGKTDTTYVVDPACSEIDYCAMVGNPYLCTLDLNNVFLIRRSGVMNCSELKTVVADNLEYTESGVFANTKVFDGVDDGFISVGKVLFAYNGDATNLTVSGNYVSIAPFAFAGNETLETVVIEGNAIENIYEGAFFCCDKLSTVYIKNLNNTVYVGDGVFDDSVQNIYVSEPLKSEYDNSADWQEYADKLAVHTTTVSFESNGGSECADKSIPYGSYIGELPAPTRNGYIFEGWHRVSDLSDFAVSQADLWDEIADGVTFYAKWAPVRYAVWFVVDLQTGATDTALDGYYTIEDGFAFGTSERTGYTFGGWYTDRELTDAVTGFAAGETGDKTYYAKWIANKTAVTLNVNDSEKFPATVATTSGEAEYDSSDFAFTVPTRAGFEFNGWYADVGGQKLFLTDADGKAVKKWDIAAESIELYADWTRSAYYIKIDADGKIVWLGADGFTDIETPIEFGTVFDDAEDMEKAFNPEKLSLKEGHKFKYFTLSDGSKFFLWESIASKFKSGDTVEINAEFEKEINFSIDFYGQETGINNPFIGAFGDIIVYYTVSKTGYTFKHWIVTESDSLNEKFIGTSLAPGTVFDYTKMPDLSVGYEEDGTHIYLEAVFEPNNYTVNFETHRGIAPLSVNIFYDEIKTFGTVYAVGYDFIGWETADGRMITNPDGNMLAAWDIASDQTLYAKWEVIEYTITYVLNGGINHSGNVTKYTIESPTIILYNATRTEYRFMGWRDNENFGNIVNSIPCGSYGDRTFNANWAKIITVYFNSNGGTYVSPMTGITGQIITLPTAFKPDVKGTWNYWGFITNDASVSNFGEKYTIGTQDITFTAAWKRYKFNVTFYQREGSGGTTSTVAEYGKKMPQITLPTRTAHNFLGYYTAPNGGGTRYYEFFDPKIYPDDYYERAFATDCDFERDTALYAYWEPMTWSISVWGFLAGSGYVNFPDSPAYPTHLNLSYNQQQIYYTHGILDYTLNRWELTYSYGLIASGTNTRIDLTNLCKGNYSNYTLTFYYNYTPNRYIENNIEVVIVGKIDNTWQIRITNYTHKKTSFQYNARMCFKTDARDWKNLEHITETEQLEHGDSSKILRITEYGTATSIAISYMENDDKRNVFYADQLSSTKHTMKSYGNTIDYSQTDDSCVAEGTLITLADGSKKAVEDLTGDEMLLVWNLHTGSFDYAPMLFIDKDPETLYRVINLTFSDGTIVKVISEHGFWDVDMNRYVYLDENAAEFIGHRFMKQNGSGMTEVTLTNVEIRTETTRAYSPVTYGHLCYYVNGMLSMPGGITGLFNIFETCGDLPRYDADAMAEDIDAYGLFTYEEFRQTYPVSEEVFEAFNGRYLKVAIGKGLITQERIGELIERYSEFFRT